MHARRYLYSLVLISFFIFSTFVQARIILQGDPEHQDARTFSFALLPDTVFDGSNLYVASSTDLGVATDELKSYALTGFKSTALVGVPLAPATVTLDGAPDATNPLFGAKMFRMGTFKSKPFCVTDNTKANAYFIASTPGTLPQKMVTLTGLKDANSGNIERIQAITGMGSSNYCFVAVAPMAGMLKTNAGIALVKFDETAQTFSQMKAVVDSDDVKAARCDLTTGALKINNDLADVNALATRVIDLHFDATLNRLFVAVQVVSGAGGNHGARNIMVGRVIQAEGQDAKLVFYPITPDAAISPAIKTEIVGAKNGSVNAFAYKVRTMHTSTGLPYLIVVGSVNDTNGTFRRKVYALKLTDEGANPDTPYVTWNASETHATLAHKDSTVTRYFKTFPDINSSLYRASSFTTRATAAGHLAKETDLAAKVGGGPITDFYNVGDLQDIVVYKDTIFASFAGNVDLPIVCYTQPIFDKDGVIVAWTPWKKVMETTGNELNIQGLAYLPSEGNLLTISTVNELPQTSIVSRRAWGLNTKDGLLGGTTDDASLGFTSQITQEFPAITGGVMGLFDFGPSYYGTVFAQGDTRTAMMIATGYGKVVLCQTMAEGAVGQGPLKGDFSDKIFFTRGAISVVPNEPCRMIFVTGGALEKIKAITCATIVKKADGDDQTSYLVVGGSHGWAVLRDIEDPHRGWTADGLNQSFQNIGNNLEFFYFDIPHKVRALKASGDYLYLLTDKALYRIIVTALHRVDMTYPLIASPEIMHLEPYHTFLDIAVSGKVALLATTAGLYRIGNGLDVSNEASVDTAHPEDIVWTKIALPESVGTVSKLYTLSSGQYEYEFSSAGPGQLYALANSVSSDATAVYRFAIKSTAADPVDDTTVQLIFNQFIENNESPYVNFGSFRNHFYTDGALTFSTAYNTIKHQYALKQIPLSTIGLPKLFSYLSETTINPGINALDTVYGFVRNSSMGSLIAYGSFGIITHE